MIASTSDSFDALLTSGGSHSPPLPSFSKTLAPFKTSSSSSRKGYEAFPPHSSRALLRSKVTSSPPSSINEDSLYSSLPSSSSTHRSVSEKVSSIDLEASFGSAKGVNLLFDFSHLADSSLRLSFEAISKHSLRKTLGKISPLCFSLPKHRPPRSIPSLLAHGETLLSEHFQLWLCQWSFSHSSYFIFLSIEERSRLRINFILTSTSSSQNKLLRPWFRGIMGSVWVLLNGGFGKTFWEMFSLLFTSSSFQAQHRFSRYFPCKARIISSLRRITPFSSSWCDFKLISCHDKKKSARFLRNWEFYGQRFMGISLWSVFCVVSCFVLHFFFSELFTSRKWEVLTLEKD